MRIIENLPTDKLPETAVCIGKFDGLHLGHKLLIDDVCERAETSLMLTFLFQGSKNIYTREEKIRLAEAMGIDIYVEIPATREFFATKPEDFVRDILVSKLNAKKVVVGEDFRFGKERTGDIYLLDDMQSECDYSLYAYTKRKNSSGEIISSSRIREYIEQGNMEKVTEMLGRRYSISGKVASGNHIGRTIDARTANIVPAEEKLLPPNGVYAVKTSIYDANNQVVKDDLFGVGNLGNKPTIGAGYPTGLEVNLFDFDGDIYGEEIKVELLSFIRKEEKFNSIEELKKQIEKDKNSAERIINTLSIC